MSFFGAKLSVTTQRVPLPSFRPATRALRDAACVALAMFALTTPVAAALYKWTDATGRIVYSDQPPVGNMKVDVVGGAPPPANPNAAKDMANKEAEFKKRQTDQAEAAAKDEKARAEAVRTNNYCMQVRNQIMGLQQPNVSMYRLNEKGERVLMDEPERKAEVERLDRALRERNCVR